MAMHEHWMAKAFAHNKGKFSRKAKRAGMSTEAYSKKEAHAGGTLGKEATLARTAARINRGR
jgi:hypothetical protein